MSKEHTFVSPGPAGLGALAVACFGFGAVFTGKVGLGGLPLLAAWLVGGGIVQYTVAVMELKDHNMTGGNVFLFFSAFFMFGAALSVLAKYLMLSGVIGTVKPESMVEGFCWMAGAAFLTAVTPSRVRNRFSSRHVRGERRGDGVAFLPDFGSNRGHNGCPKKQKTRFHHPFSAPSPLTPQIHG